METLKVKYSKTIYSLEQKLAVIKYYQTSGQGLRFVAAHFDIHLSQVRGFGGETPKSQRVIENYLATLFFTLLIEFSVIFLVSHSRIMWWIGGIFRVQNFILRLLVG